MQWLPTALSTVLFCAVLGLYLSARMILSNAEHEVRRFRGMAGRVVALEGVCDQLRQQIARVRGKVYAEKLGAASDEEGAPPIPLPPSGCENWNLAQIEGPRSKAAACECEYCTAMRDARARVKQNLVPKTNADRLAAIQKGLES